MFGQDLATLDADQALALRRRWGVMFQRGGLFGALTVRQNVACPCASTACAARHWAMCWTTR